MEKKGKGDGKCCTERKELLFTVHRMLMIT